MNFIIFPWTNSFYPTEGVKIMQILNQPFSRLLLTTVFCFSMGNQAVLADDDEDEIHSLCTQAAIDAAELYDPGSGSLTECIGVRDDFKVVMAWNSKAVNGRILKVNNENAGQQVVNARNLVRDYKNNYDMTHGDAYEMVVVAYAGGVDWLKKDSDPINISLVQGLMDKGIKIYACQNTMKAKGLKIAELLDGVRIVPAGVSAVLDFSNRDYTYLTP